MSEVQPESEVQEIVEPIYLESRFIDPKKLNLQEETLTLNRCAKVVKGGRRFSFAAMVAVGDSNGHVGLGFGKANEVPDAIQKATERAKKSLIRVPLMGRTIPHEIIGRHDAARVLLKPASEGTGLIASAVVRKYLALAGVHDVLAKNLGSDNTVNVIKAVLNAMRSMKKVDEIARLRGKKVESLIGRKNAALYEKTRMAILSASDPEGVRRMMDEARKKSETEAQAAKEAKAAEAVASPELTDDIQNP